MSCCNNRDNLKNKICSIVKNSHNNAIEALKTNSTRQMFTFEKCYTMIDSGIITKHNSASLVFNSSFCVRISIVNRHLSAGVVMS